MALRSHDILNVCAVADLDSQAYLGNKDAFHTVCDHVITVPC